MPVTRALVEGSPQATVSDPAQTAVGAGAGVVLVANPKRKGLVIQNTGTTILYFTYGGTAPTVTVYHFALKGCSTHDDGTGATWFDSSWVGAVNAIGSAGGGTCVITETSTGSPDWNQAEDYGMKGFLG